MVNGDWPLPTCTAAGGMKAILIVIGYAMPKDSFGLEKASLSRGDPFGAGMVMPCQRIPSKGVL